jgi:hypothetical protein
VVILSSKSPLDINSIETFFVKVKNNALVQLFVPGVAALAARVFPNQSLAMGQSAT